MYRHYGDFIETMISQLYTDLNWKRDNLELALQNLKDSEEQPFDETDPVSVQRRNESIEHYLDDAKEYRLIISECEKLIKELEKMARE